MATRTDGWSEGGRLLILLMAMLLVMSTIILAIAGSGIDGTRMLIRASARSSLLLFVAAFTAGALVRLRSTPATRWTIRNRRWLGLGFAFSHLIHLLAILWLFGAYGDRTPPPPISTLVGGESPMSSSPCSRRPRSTAPCGRSAQRTGSGCTRPASGTSG